MAHVPASLYPIKNHGELAVALCFVFLYLTFGGGRWTWMRCGEDDAKRPPSPLLMT